MTNGFWQDDQDEGEFRDIPEEVSGQDAPAAQVRVNRPVAATPQANQPVQQPQYIPEPEVQSEEEQEEDFSSVLNDARFRLEQGRLYELLLNHEIFAGVEADDKAIKFVQKQIRNYAKEQMEIMLGMRQEQSKVEALSAADFPFNDLEVQTLKALASAATKGASATPEAQQYSGVQAQPRRVGLNTISAKTVPRGNPTLTTAKPAQKPLPQKAAQPVKRDQRTEAQIERILAEEGISREEYERQYNPNYKPLTKPVEQMNDAELKEWKRQDALKTNKQVKNPMAIPMPTAEQEEMIHTSRAQAAQQNPQMQQIMSLLNNMPKKQ